MRPKKGELRDRRRYGSRGANLISKKIPLRMTDWETSRVGYLELGIDSDNDNAFINDQLYRYSQDLRPLIRLP